MKHARSRRWQLVITSGLMCLVIGTPSVLAQKKETNAKSAKSEEGRFGFVLDERPSFRFGDGVRLDLTSTFDFEWREADENASDGAEFGRRRIGVDGRVFGVLAFEVERELGDAKDPWRDVFVEFRKYRAVRVRAGRFKVPFGAERLTPVSDLDFVGRATATEVLTPGRDTGVQVAGRVLGDAVTYTAGAFRHDGSSRTEARETTPRSGQTVAARLTVAPFAHAQSMALRRIQSGIGFTSGDLAEGLNSVALRTTGGFEAFAPMYVSGFRRRLGVDASFIHGAFSVRGELLRTADQRLNQGLSGDDLPDLFARGWQLSGTWMAVGALKNGGKTPKQPLFGGGAGAIQLAARVEAVTIRSDAAWDDAFRNPRAVNVLPNDFRAWTAGVNWYPVRFLKVQLNLIREHLGDPERRPDPSRSWTTSRVFRVQFSL